MVRFAGEMVLGVVMVRWCYGVMVRYVQMSTHQHSTSQLHMSTSQHLTTSTSFLNTSTSRLLLRLRRNNLEQFVAWSDLRRHAERHVLSLVCCADGFKVVAYLVNVYVHHARCRTGDEQLVANRELHRLARELSHADVREILHAATHVHLLLRSVRSVVAVPLAQSLTLIVAVPKPRLKTVASVASHSSFFSSVNVPSSTAAIACL